MRVILMVGKIYRFINTYICRDRYEKDVDRVIDDKSIYLGITGQDLYLVYI